MTPLELLKNAQTPRTDELLGNPDGFSYDQAIEHARALERENAALHEALQRLCSPWPWPDKDQEAARAVLAAIEKD